MSGTLDNFAVGSEPIKARRCRLLPSHMDVTYLLAKSTDVPPVRKAAFCCKTSPLVVRLRWKGAAALLHNHRRCICACLAALIHRQALDHARQEAAHVGVPRTVRVHELLLGQHNDGVLGAMPTHAYNGGVGTLCDHHGALPPLGARDEGQPRSDELNVRALPALGLRPGPCFGLVTEEEVHVGHCLHKDGLEWRHLHEEGG